MNLNNLMTKDDLRKGTARILREIKAIRKIIKETKKMDDVWRKKHGRKVVEEKLNIPLAA